MMTVLNKLLLRLLTTMGWVFEGVTCHGVFKPEASVAIFNFTLQESMVTITYRAVDANSCVAAPPIRCKAITLADSCGGCRRVSCPAMAVCIVDVDSDHTPTIQYGNMCVSLTPPAAWQPAWFRIVKA
jgi:hypothetical protein